MSLSTLLRRSVNLVPWSWRDRIRQVPGLAATQRWLLASFVGHEPFLHEINAGPARGLRVMIALPADKGLWTGTYESHFVGAVAAAVQPGSICFDIGGFHGFVSGVMALAGARQVLCFEPLPANLAVIRQLTSLNPALPIEIRGHAVGAADGQVIFTVMAEDSMGKLESSPFQSGQPGRTSIPVSIRSLDALLSENKIAPPSLLKIDVEGAELDVLRGSRRLLSTHHPEIFAEIHSPELRVHCEEFLRQLGYDILDIAAAGASIPSSTGVSHLRAAFGPGVTGTRPAALVAASQAPRFRARARAGTKSLLRRTSSLGMEALLYARSRRLDPGEPGRTLVVSPHPDDECLGCGALLARLAHDDPAAVHVAYVTDGSKSHPGHPSLSAEDLARTRREEAQAALAVLGVKWANVHHLDIEDGSLAHLDPAASRVLVERLSDLFAALRPARIILPLRCDGSSEHDSSFDHVSRALRAVGLPTRLLEFPVWANWRPPLLIRPLRTARRVLRFSARPWLRQKEDALRAHRSQLQPVAPWEQPVVSSEFVSYFLRPHEFYFEFA